MWMVKHHFYILNDIETRDIFSLNSTQWSHEKVYFIILVKFTASLLISFYHKLDICHNVMSAALLERPAPCWWLLEGTQREARDHSTYCCLWSSAAYECPVCVSVYMCDRDGLFLAQFLFHICMIHCIWCLKGHKMEFCVWMKCDLCILQVGWLDVSGVMMCLMRVGWWAGLLDTFLYLNINCKKRNNQKLKLLFEKIYFMNVLAIFLILTSFFLFSKFFTHWSGRK